MSFYATRECYYCGPRIVTANYRGLKKSEDTIACPQCGLEPGEVRMIEEVREYGFEEALRREARRALRSS